MPAGPREKDSSIAPALARDRDYWAAATALVRRDNELALSAAAAVLGQASRIGNDELAWRCAAIAAAAAGAAHRVTEQQTYRATAADALSRLRAAWGRGVSTYDARPDFVELRKAANL